MKYDVIICGNGRVGAQVYSALKASGLNLEQARIDAELGLQLSANTSQSSLEVTCLVICISPAESGNSSFKWQWDEILHGLIRQAHLGVLKVEKLIFISSTRVFDGYTKGIISAQTAPSGNSRRANQLILAEQQLQSVAVTSWFIRAAGLYGKGYSKYTEILSQKSDKVRFGVNVETLIQRIVNICMQLPQSSQRRKIRFELLTDTALYWRGVGQPLDINSELHQTLGQQQRLLVNSRSAWIELD